MLHLPTRGRHRPGSPDLDIPPRRLRVGLRGHAAALPLALLLALQGCAPDGAPATGDQSPPAAPAAELTGSGGTNAPAHRDAPHVVLVSFDGFRWDYMDLYEAPAFQRVAEAGVRAERMIPVFPTKTFPTHYSMATGMYAENHGLVGNRYWDPERRARYDMGDREVVEDGDWYRGEPIWVTAETQGMVSASYFFVGSEADVKGVRPTHWYSYDGSVPNEARVDRVLEWLALPAEERPRMVTLYFSDVDGAGHGYGPGSAEVRASVAEVDRMLGRLLDGVEALPHGEEVYLVLVSDHGMLLASADSVQVVDPERFPGVRVAEAGPYASLFVEEGGPERAEQVRDSLQAVLTRGRVWLREDVPERFHYSDDPRIGDLVVLMDPGWTVTTPDRVPDADTWTHGWDNRIEPMGAIFLAMGPGIQGGQRIAPFESVHLHPFLARLLGLEPAAGIDGRPEVLAPVLDQGG